MEDHSSLALSLFLYLCLSLSLSSTAQRKVTTTVLIEPAEQLESGPSEGDNPSRGQPPGDLGAWTRPPQPRPLPSMDRPDLHHMQVLK